VGLRGGVPALFCHRRGDPVVPYALGRRARRAAAALGYAVLARRLDDGPPPPGGGGGGGFHGVSAREVLEVRQFLTRRVAPEPCLRLGPLLGLLPPHDRATAAAAEAGLSVDPAQLARFDGHLGPPDAGGAGAGRRDLLEAGAGGGGSGGSPDESL
jgi:hypothetical protein